MKNRGTFLLAIWFAAGSFLFLGVCRQKMSDQPRYDPFEPSTFFEDGQSARLPVPGTIARGQLRRDQHLYQGISDGAPAKTFPFPVDRAVLERGRERFDIFCSPCHDRTGGGQGMIVRRGFPPPPSYHIDRLRNVPPGHLYQVITNGLGAMPSYASQVAPEDRWAIAAYIRALQLSQFATIDRLPSELRQKLKGDLR